MNDLSFFEHESRVNCEFPSSRSLRNVTHTWVIFTPLGIVAQNSFSSLILTF